MYSVAILGKYGQWLTNFGEYGSPEDINWDKVEQTCKQGKSIAYGYYQGGMHSNNLTSDKNRTVIKFLELPKYTWEQAHKILVNDGKLFYSTLKINDQTPDVAWVKIKYEGFGITACFGYDGKDKIVSRKWYPGGWEDFKLWLLNAGIITA